FGSGNAQYPIEHTPLPAHSLFIEHSNAPPPNGLHAATGSVASTHAARVTGRPIRVIVLQRQGFSSIVKAGAEGCVTAVPTSGAGRQARQVRADPPDRGRRYGRAVSGAH